MSFLLTKEGGDRDTTQLNPDGQFRRALESVTEDEIMDFVPAGRAGDDLLRVLIVDDHRTTADTLTSLVRTWGHNVRCAYDGVTGLALAAALQPDVLLLDALMSNVSGIEVAEHVRRQDRFKDCFIVAVTGRTDAKHRSRCYEAGIDLVLLKPIDPSHMQTLLMLESQRVRSRKDENLNHLALFNQ